MHLLDILAILATGLMVGNELAVSLFVNPALWQLDATAQVRAISLLARSLGRAMPFWYAFCLILLIAETVLRHNQPVFLPLLAATSLWAAVIVFTIVVLVPINNRVASLPTSVPLADWLPAHKGWDKLHRLRIMLLILAMLLLINSLLATR